MPFDPNMICFACLKQLNERDGICPHCGHDNHNRQNQGQQLPFSIIGGKYLIGKCLGQGGFGITYLGYDIPLNRRVAIKEYFPNNVAMRTAGSSELSTQGMEQRTDFMTGVGKFITEAQMLVALDEIPNIVRVFDAFLANSTAYIVMDYVEGQTLSQYLEAHGGKLSMKETMQLFEPLFDSLAALHRENIIHRDLKPSNLMLRAKDGQLILLDFGAARTYLDNANGMTTFHTNGYSPKEQYVRNGKQDGRTDEYALCATIYRTITGKNPPTSVERQLHEDTIIPPSKYCNDITPKQEAALLKGMSMEIDARYPDVLTLKKALYAPQEEPKDEKPVAMPAQDVPAQEHVAPKNTQQAKPKRTVLPWIVAAACMVVTVVVLTGSSRQAAPPAQSRNAVVAVATNTAAPAATKTPVPTNTPKPTATPTPKPTATPKPTPTPTPKPRTFELSPTLSTNKGLVTVSWTDSANHSPYVVSYQQIASGDVNTPSFWAGGNESDSTTYSKSFTIEDLAPGKTYRISIFDSNVEMINRTYTIPDASTFVDGNLSATSIKTSISPRSKAATDSDKNARSSGSLKSATIQSDMGSKDYGFEYRVKYPGLAYNRRYFTQIFIISPDGFTLCEVCDEINFEQRYGGRYWYMLGDRTFAKYYEYNKKIIPGEWTVELYFDGQFVNERTFNVN